MIADVCAALLQNLVLGTTEYCLHFLDTEYQALEDYDRQHRREIGKYLKPKISSSRSRPLGLMALGLGFMVLLVCNCIAWSVIRI